MDGGLVCAGADQADIHQAERLADARISVHGDLGHGSLSGVYGATTGRDDEPGGASGGAARVASARPSM